MDQFVLIGPSGNAGIVAKLDDLEEGAAVPVAYERAEREVMANTWVHVDQTVVPKGANEMLLKVSRHLRHADRIWTWIGCYFHADIPGAQRSGAYIGCGVAALNAELTVKPIMGVITNAAMALFDEGMRPRVSRQVSAGNLDEMHRTILKAAIVPGLTETGLQPRSGKKAFVDLSAWPDNDTFNTKLVEVIHAALTNPAFEPFDEVIVINTAQLADRALSSRRYQRLTEKDWTTPRIPPLAPPPVIPEPQPPNVVPRAPIADGYAAPVSDVRPLSDPLQSLERRVLALENVKLHDAMLRRPNWIRRRWIIGAAVAGVLAAVAVAAAALFLHRPETAVAETRFQNCPQHSVETNPFDGDDAAQPDLLEVACLNNQIRTARARLDQLTPKRDGRAPAATDSSSVIGNDNAAKPVD